jgi:predicted nucleic acid-binding Zn ribbon protein
MADEPLKACPCCGGEVRRLIGTGAGLIFKGSGFYETDYRSDSYKKAAKADTTADVLKKTDGDAGKKVAKES